MSPGKRRPAPRPKLRELADRLGILPEYVDQTVRGVRRTTDATREALLGIMGFDAPTEDAAAGWLAELDHEARSEILAPVRVVERDDRTAHKVRVQLPPGAGRCQVTVTFTEEHGDVWEVSAEMRRSGTLALPSRPGYGYHTVVAEVISGNTRWQADQSLIVVPSRCVTPDMIVGKRKVAGVVTNLYAARREQDWGVGDFTTLTLLVEWAAARGCEFVGVNPLHALFNRGTEISPYSPVSRLFRNHLYIDVDALPEPLLRAVQSLTEELGPQLQALRAAPAVDYDRVIATKERVLAAAHRAFRTSGPATRHGYDEFVQRREPELSRYATWMAIAENAGSTDWRQWPEPMRDGESSSVRGFQAAHAERIDFHRWLQFEAHRQLGEAAARARALGMAIGVYQDLAIGTNPGGSDTWSYPDLFHTGASVGAPPDPYSATGQNWGLPPLSPRALRAQRYRYWIQLLRRAFEHAGALRLDHIMGLFRMLWIPEGHTALDGAYVRYPSEDLLGILALESVRHDAVVVGEDLGTVPPNVPPAMKKWGILSSKVLYFERDARGFRGRSKYPPLSLATANTHDMAPLAGFWRERDVELRSQVGLIATPTELRAVRRGRAEDKRQLLRLVRVPWPDAAGEARFARTLTGAVHDFLCATPSQLVGLSLDDLVGEVDPVNVPGVGPDKHPSWRRRNRMTVEAMTWNAEVDATFRCDARRSRE